MENKTQDNKDLLAEKNASVSQLQEQHAIELAKHKTKLDEEQSKLQLVTQELELSKSDIAQLRTDANRNTVALEAQKKQYKEERDAAVQELERLTCAMHLIERARSLKSAVVTSRDERLAHVTRLLSIVREFDLRKQQSQ